MNKYYAGIGSRETPPEIMALMTRIAAKLEREGYVLRSGGAPGADAAFEAGVTDDRMKQIFIPWDGFQDRPATYPIPQQAYDIAGTLHKHWEYLKGGARTLMARNALQILGPNLDTPAQFVVCWTPDGCISEEDRSYAKVMGTGGTGQAIAHAWRMRIAIFNLARPEHKARLEAML